MLRQLSFGERVAELERDELAEYFVETDQWRKVYQGESDVIFGNKGSGKSALYAALNTREDDLFDRGVLLISAENPRGDTAFAGIVPDPPPGEFEFISLWKTYIISLVASEIRDLELSGSSAQKLVNVAAAAGMLPLKGATLQTRLKLAWTWVKQRFQFEEFEGGVKLDPVTQAPIGITGKVRLREPDPADRAAGAVSLDDMFAMAEQALDDNDIAAWVLFDRLDVAFVDSPDLEANALRALFKTYLSLNQLKRVRFKIFLRSDIWSVITGGGFREASHITKRVDLQWGRDSLRNLVVRRMLSNPGLVEHYGLDADRVKSDAALQEELLKRAFPAKVDVGKNPETFDWVLGRVRDGTRTSAPREVIHLLTEARNAQLAMLERGEPDPPDDQVIARPAFREALAPVSEGRLHSTLIPEFPHLRDFIMAFEGGKTDYSIDNLQALWEVEEERAAEVAQQLVEIGFLELREASQGVRYWIPFLYRPALRLKQGAADD